MSLIISNVSVIQQGVMSCKYSLYDLVSELIGLYHCYTNTTLAKHPAKLLDIHKR